MDEDSRRMMHHLDQPIMEAHCAAGGSPIETSSITHRFFIWKYSPPTGNQVVVEDREQHHALSLAPYQSEELELAAPKMRCLTCHLLSC